MDTRPHGLRLTCVRPLAILCVVGCAWPWAAARGAGPLVPGKVNEVRDPASGRAGGYVVYLPAHYTPEHGWPALFCYHGRGSGPTVDPYRQYVGGEHFVIVGLDYTWDSMNTASKIDNDVSTIRRLLPELVQRLHLDPHQLFIAGNSAGGFLAGGVAEATPSLWAGVAILGAGRYYHLHHRPFLPAVGGRRSWPPGAGGAGPIAPKGAAAMAGKPVYIGVGEQDTNRQFADWAARSYRRMGAAVTFEEYAGRGHGDYPPSEVLAQWFNSCGPLRQAASNLTSARKAESAGRLGEAYGKYQRTILPVWAPPKAAEKARQAADRLRKQARGQLAAAETALAATPFDEKQFDKGVRMLTAVAQAFRGCGFGEQAAQRLLAAAETALRRDRTDMAARILRVLARTLGDSAIGRRARQRLVELRKDNRTPQQGDAVHQTQKAERDCRQWLQMAGNLMAAGQTEKAKTYLKKVLDAYPNTAWARDAGEQLKQLQ